MRVRVQSLIFKRWNGEAREVGIGNLVLPDGSLVEREPVFVEGTLREFTRQVGMILVNLGPLSFDGSAEGRLLFRGRPAVILRGPATVQLHSSQFLEKVPTDNEVYWSHLTSGDGQMNLPLGG